MAAEMVEVVIDCFELQTPNLRCVEVGQRFQPTQAVTGDKKANRFCIGMKRMNPILSSREKRSNKRFEWDRPKAGFASFRPAPQARR
jgi:hypothetical protein